MAAPANPNCNHCGGYGVGGDGYVACRHCFTDGTSRTLTTLEAKRLREQRDAERAAVRALIAKRAKCEDCGAPATLYWSIGLTPGYYCDDHWKVGTEDLRDAEPLRALLALMREW